MAPKMYRGLSILPKLETFLRFNRRGLVGERLKCSEVGAVRPGGALGSENAGMSSVMQMDLHRKPKVSRAMPSAEVSRPQGIPR